MDGDDNSFDDDDRTALNRRLPVVIPPPKIPRAAPVWHFVLPYLQLVLVAVIASGVGVLSAALWPYHAALKDVVATSLRGSRENSDHPSLATTRLNRPAVMVASETCHVRNHAPQLIMSGPSLTLRANQPASLGLRVEGAPEGAQLVICGFAAKSIISAGQSIDDKTWMLPVSDIADATLIPPTGFVGAMQLDVVLVNLDKTVADRKTMLLLWQPQEPDPPSAPAPLAMRDAAESDIDQQLEAGVSLEAMGNLPLARGIFLHFAQQRNARAAYLLANSYDPISLAKRQLLPPESDLALARIWYRKASDWGLRDAAARLERLANW